jgi:hypothetical protein
VDEAHRKALSARIHELMDARRFVEALPLLRERASIEPAPWAVHADLAIAAKHAAAWDEARAACRRAIELGGDEVDTGVHWNAGIAATALGDWALARRSWARCGLTVPGTEGPIDWQLGLVPIRIDPRDAAEVVWCSRICPARAIIRNIPTGDRRYGDLLIHDGEPRGERALSGRTISVFDELAVLEPSPYATWVVEIEAAAAADVDALREVIAGTIERLEDWTANVRVICRACSEGLPHADHDTGGETAWATERRIAIATAGAIDQRLLQAWESSGEGRRVLMIETPE